MSIRFKNYSMFTKKVQGDDWYEWCVFVDSDKAEVRRIKHVEYTLHPTFRDPKRLVTDKEHRFALVSDGWGGFPIKIRVVFEDGSEEFTSHMLQLQMDDWPTKQPPPRRFDDTEADLIYRVLTEGKYRWRKLGTVAAKTGLLESRVESVLRKLEEQDYVRKLPHQSLDGQALWAATAVVGVWPRL